MSKKLLSVVCSMLLVLSLFACAKPIKEYEEILDASSDYEVKTESIERTVRPTETVKQTEKVDDYILEQFETRGETEEETEETDSDSEETSLSEEETTEVILETVDIIYEEDNRVFEGNNYIDTSNWDYGSTPCEWIFVEPGVQIVSNVKPNGSANYSITKKVSSGLKGCYLPIFTKCDMVTNTMEGRFYCFEDYTRYQPNDLRFSNSLADLEYKGVSVEFLLTKGFPNIKKSEKGLLSVNGVYMNIIYVTDLDSIIDAVGESGS